MNVFLTITSTIASENTELSSLITLYRQHNSSYTHKKAIAGLAVPVFSNRKYRSVVRSTFRPLITQGKKASVRIGELQRNSGHGGLCMEPNPESTVLAINSKPLEVVSRSKMSGDYFCRRTCEHRIKFVNHEVVWKS
jgi:hypothetical protein